MERKKYKLVLITLFCLAGNIQASYKSDIYTAYISNNMQIWKNVLDRMNSLPNKNTELLLELVNYQYGFIGWCVGTKEYSDAKKYLSQAEENLDILSRTLR